MDPYAGKTVETFVNYPTIFVIFGITGDLAGGSFCRRFWPCSPKNFYQIALP